MVDRNDTYRFGAVFGIAHQVLQDTPGLQYEDMEACPQCRELVERQAERMAEGATLRKTALGKGAIRITEDDIFWAQRKPDLLEGFGNWLQRKHIDHP